MFKLHVRSARPAADEFGRRPRRSHSVPLAGPGKIAGDGRSLGAGMRPRRCKKVKTGRAFDLRHMPRVSAGHGQYGSALVHAIDVAFAGHFQAGNCLWATFVRPVTRMELPPLLTLLADMLIASTTFGSGGP